VRLAWVVADLEAARAFWGDGVGLPVRTTFAGHAGWSGLVLTLPGGAELELTTGPDALPAAGAPDDLLVLSMTEAEARLVAARLPHAPRPRPDNPWWHRGAITMADPDGHRLVLAWTPGPT